MTAPEPPAVWWHPAVPMYLFVDRGEGRPGEVEVWRADWGRGPLSKLPADAARLVPEHPGVAALLRRCDDIEAKAASGAWRMIHIDAVRALLGGADNNNEGEQ